MKLSNVAAIVAVAALSAAACAQGRPGGFGMGRPGMGGPGGPGGFGRGPMTPEQQAQRTVQRLTEALGLTPAQQAKVKAIALKNAILIKKIRDGQEAQIKKVLTADQAKKLAAMPRPGMGGFGGGRPGMGGPGGMRRGG